MSKTFVIGNSFFLCTEIIEYREFWKEVSCMNTDNIICAVLGVVFIGILAVFLTVF